MQKLVNVLAIFSFGVCASSVVGGVWLYSNRAELIESAKEAAINEAKSLLPELLSGSLPELPASLPTTGESSPLPSTPSLPF